MKNKLFLLGLLSVFSMYSISVRHIRRNNRNVTVLGDDDRRILTDVNPIVERLTEALRGEMVATNQNLLTDVYNRNNMVQTFRFIRSGLLALEEGPRRVTDQNDLELIRRFAGVYDDQLQNWMTLLHEGGAIHQEQSMSCCDKFMRALSCCIRFMR